MKLTVTTFLTLDGVMQGPGLRAEDGFDLGGWLVPHADEDMMRIHGEWFAAADALLLGRVTYEIFASYWPRVTDPHDLFAPRLNSMPKYVASRTRRNYEWTNSSHVGDDAAAAVARLKQQPGRELQVHGSGGLVRTLMAHDLVDEYRLWHYPVVLGRGKRLFSDGCPPTGLELLGSRTTAAGVVVNSYRSAGRPRFGSFDLVESGGATSSRPRVED